MLCPSFEYQLLNTESYAKSFCVCDSPSINWILNGKLPEVVSVTPTTSTQVIRASAKNRYLDEVIVAATSSTTTTS